jgi:tetratricopeptide (TPR) repeat protein
MVTAFLLPLLLGSPAHARERATVAIVGLHDPDLDPEGQRALVDRLAEAVEDGRRFEARRPADVARAIAGREEVVLADAFLASGRRLLEDGRILHDQAQPEEAAPVLEQAVDGLQQGMRAVDATRELWEAWLYLGSSHMALGEEEAATAAWRAAVALAPERQPDAARIAPTVVQAYRAVQVEAAQQTGALVVRADGKPRIRMNGRDLGEAPARLDAHPAGTVHLRAMAENGAMVYQPVEIVAGEETTATLPPGGLGLPESGDSTFARSRGATDLYKALGAQLDVDFLLVAGGRDGTASLQVYAPASDTFSRPLEVACGGTCADAIVGSLPELLGVLGEDGTIPSMAAVPSAGPVGTSGNVLLAGLLLDPEPVAAPASAGVQWWQLAAAGGGALLLGGGITALAVAGGGGGDRGTIVVGPVPE